MRVRERISPWAVTATGDAYQLGTGAHPDVHNTRAIVLAANPTEALNAAEDLSFKIGIKNATDTEPAEIMIAGFIGDPYAGCDARSVQQFMRANRGRPVIAYIDSGGGLAWDGIAMHNAFVNHDAPVTAIIQSIAGSAATLPAVGAGVTKIYENATFFIHRAACLAYGNRDAMSEAMDWLDAIDESIARTYKAKTHKAMDKITAIMAGSGKNDGTLYTAREAVAEKFCTEMVPLKNTSAKNSTAADKKPANCNCEYPETRYRNGSGHHDSCPAHKEWQEAGGFNQQRPLTEAESPRFIEAARALRMRTRAGLFGGMN